MIMITHGPIEIVRQLKYPACAFPLAIFGIALIGTAWATHISWTDRLHGLEKTLKLLWFAPLFLHFQKTIRIASAFKIFVASNLLLLGFSFLVFFSTTVSHVVKPHEPGIPLKNYIDQTQAFVFIAVVFLAFAAAAIRNRQNSKAIGYVAISAAFFCNLAFVNIARTAFIYLPIMIVLLSLKFARPSLSLLLLVGFCIAAAAIWTVSPNLQSKTVRLLHEVDAFQANSTTVNGYPAGGAQRLEFWRKSIGFISAAPILGHGTGSTKVLFENEARGKAGIAATVVDNPHNQTLAVMVQWGITGCMLLYAMWIAHLRLFRDGLDNQTSDLLAWIGLLAVSQNITSSLLNSHLFDFYPGWLYLFVVCSVGGQLERKKHDR